MPDGTQLLDVNLRDGVAIVDLTSQFESGGGSLSMTARVAQVVFTATQFDNVDSVLFWMNGEPIEFLGGEGLMLDQPQARADIDRSFTGGVLIDTGDGNTILLAGVAIADLDNSDFIFWILYFNTNIS